MYVVKRTFIDVEKDASQPLRRNKSEPSLTKSFAKLEYAEPCTLSKWTSVKGDDIEDRSTTCGSSAHGDDISDVLSISGDSTGNASSGNWADISEIEVAEESNANLQSAVDEGKKEGSKKPARRSGRARQREKQRRQIRTPSPEMRNPWCECLEARILPQLCLASMI